MLVVVGVEFVLAVLKGIELLLRVAGGDVAAGHEFAHGVYGVALAVVERDKGLRVPEPVIGGGGVEAGDDLFDLSGVLFGESVARLHGLVIESGDLDHVLKGDGLEVVLPAGGLVHALGDGPAHHGDVGGVEGLVVKVLARVKEKAEVARVGVDEAGIGGVVVILEVGVRILVAAYGDSGRPAVEQVGVQQYDNYGKDDDNGADDTPARALFLGLYCGLALCEGALVSALHALGLASLLVLRCAHWCFILYI